jgi:hypothetical protein
VRRNIAGWCAPIACGLLLAAPASPQPGDARVEIEREGQESLFRLDAEQRAYSRSLGPLPPGRRLELQDRLVRQRLHQQDLQRRQLDRERGWSSPGGAPSPLGPQAERGLRLQRLQRAQDSLQLQQQMQRHTWPYREWWK